MVAHDAFVSSAMATAVPAAGASATRGGLYEPSPQRRPPYPSSVPHLPRHESNADAASAPRQALAISGGAAVALATPVAAPSADNDVGWVDAPAGCFEWQMLRSHRLTSRALLAWLAIAVANGDAASPASPTSVWQPSGGTPGREEDATPPAVALLPCTPGRPLRSVPVPAVSIATKELTGGSGGTPGRPQPPTPPLSAFELPIRPTMSVGDYANRVAATSNASPSALAVAALYLARAAAENPALTLTSTNAHRLVLLAVVTAAKYLDDLSYTNKVFVHVGGVEPEVLNTLEVHFLRAIRFRLHITPTDMVEVVRRLGRALSVSEAGAAGGRVNAYGTYGRNIPFNLNTLRKPVSRRWPTQPSPGMTVVAQVLSPIPGSPWPALRDGDTPSRSSGGRHATTPAVNRASACTPGAGGRAWRGGVGGGTGAVTPINVDCRLPTPGAKRKGDADASQLQSESDRERRRRAGSEPSGKSAASRRRAPLRVSRPSQVSASPVEMDSVPAVPSRVSLSPYVMDGVQQASPADWPATRGSHPAEPQPPAAASASGAKSASRRFGHSAQPPLPQPVRYGEPVYEPDHEWQRWPYQDFAVSTSTHEDTHAHAAQQWQGVPVPCGPYGQQAYQQPLSLPQQQLPQSLPQPPVLSANALQQPYAQLGQLEVRQPQVQSAANLDDARAAVNYHTQPAPPTADYARAHTPGPTYGSGAGGSGVGGGGVGWLNSSFGGATPGGTSRAGGVGGSGSGGGEVVGADPSAYISYFPRTPCAAARTPARAAVSTPSGFGVSVVGVGLGLGVGVPTPGGSLPAPHPPLPSESTSHARYGGADVSDGPAGGSGVGGVGIGSSALCGAGGGGGGGGGGGTNYHAFPTTPAAGTLTPHHTALHAHTPAAPSLPAIAALLAATAATVATPAPPSANTSVGHWPPPLPPVAPEHVSGPPTPLLPRPAARWLP
ncbi:hypothetical protein BU14_0455s0003 [Porphyra umbilicalis]|uniref:Cyclin N-terminal domain-containing protein n=1 Tax=Porphyra umbilicalis TaxID=2786 RepID=A0A1X6NUD6_PORUM|nr:hypothetical protein BU14_0455s0003 [Porphyra umbilicalis]|eukprot:OSX72234.1 hypothetical protein BU14_0455s0003 [Porphyra umbilicalis]